MKKTIKEMNLKESFVRNKKDIIFVSLAILLGILYNWTDMEIIIFAVFVLSILRPIPIQLFVVAALFFLVLVPITLSLDRMERAENFAVYAFYFLSMALVMGFLEMRRVRQKQL